jgi:hypothetical protein
MATDSIMGLFTTPEQYQQAQSQAALQRGVQLAQLDPLQRASAQLYQGGYLAGGAIGGALGGQDPMLKMQSFRQQVLQGVDQTDPQSLAQASYALNREGDTAGARQLAQLAQAAALNQSQVTKNMREGRAAANKVVEADGRQYLVNTLTGERIADIGAAGEKTKITEANGRTLLINERTGAVIKDLGVAPQRGTNVSSQIKLPTDINALAAGYEKAIEGDVSVKNLAFNAKGLINQAAVSNNPSAWEAARTQVAKAVGEGKLSNEDIARTGVDPTLIGGVRDWIEKKVVGVPDANTQKALFVVASYLEKNASNRIAEKRNNRIAMARQVNPDVDAAAMFPDYSSTVQTASGAGGGGGGKIVDFKDFNKKAP